MWSRRRSHALDAWQGFPTAIALGFGIMLSKKRGHLVVVLVGSKRLMN